ncbi:MAG: LysR family transcriptional regulator [Acidimicrobiales bacterium]
MTPSQLRTFVSVVDSGSVRGAAEALFVSQPAVSSALSALQAELGVALVEREGRGLRVTPAGQVLADYGRRVIRLLEEAAVATVARASPERGRLRLDAVTTAGEQVVPPSLTSFRARYPQMEIRLEVGNRRRTWELLTSHGADLAIGGRPAPGGNLVSLAARNNQLVVVAPPPWGAGEVSLSQLAEATWLMREPGSGTRATNEELLEDLGISPPTLTLGSNGAIVESVKAGLGVALVSLDAARRELADGMVVEWRAEPLPLRRRWHLVARGGESLPATAGLFVDHLTSEGDWVPSPQTLLPTAAPIAST